MLGSYSLGGYSLEVTDFGFENAPSGRLQAGRLQSRGNRLRV